MGTTGRHIRAKAWREIGLLALLLFALACGNASAQFYEKVFSFTEANAALAGSFPNGGLLLGRDGNLYGTTSGGGPSSSGTIYKITPNGVVTTLVIFSGYGAQQNQGSGPGGLIQATDGNIYGTTGGGGTGNLGTVFRTTLNGELTTLVDFLGNGVPNRGSTPGPGLVEGNDGNFYGTANGGGVYDCGTVYRMTPGGDITTLVDFTGTTLTTDPHRGNGPVGSMVQAADGNFYGTTGTGGVYGYGTIFKLAIDGTLTTLVDFTGSTTVTDQDRGRYPAGGLIQASDGNFYGTTSGTVFSITPGGTMTTLVDLTAESGIDPVGELIQASDGNFYGTASYGGTNNDGTVFEVTPSGNLIKLVDFTDRGSTNAGSLPEGGLIQNSDGNFYGTTVRGGLYGYGTVFKMTPTRVLTTIVNFSNISDPLGSTPNSLVQAIDGNFYGTTGTGGANSAGTIFQMTPAGVLNKLVDCSFVTTSQFHGADPAGALAQTSSGNFYGTAPAGGANSDGTIFQMTPAGVITTLVDFTGNGATNRGASPECNLVLGRDGYYYGTTAGGGQNSEGTIFRLTPAGATTLVDFTGSTNPADPDRGAAPYAGLIQGSDGNFYGTTHGGGLNGLGTIFQMTPAGTMTTLIDFTGNGPATQQNRGSNPYAGLVQGIDGYFYGTTVQGGVNTYGTIFKMLVTNGAATLTTLVDFTNDTDVTDPNRGSAPYGGLIQGKDGNFYGGTEAGGASHVGTVYQMTPAGVMTVLNDFSSDPLDSSPNSTLFRASDDNLYGTTYGGYNGFGSIYRLVFPGAPNVYLNLPISTTTTTASFTLSANARRATTSVELVFDTVAANLSSDTPISISVDLNGYATTPLGTTLSNLTPGTTYYYQVTAKNSYGTTTTPVGSFTTYEAPAPAVLAATPISQASEILNGTVNASNNPTTVPVTFQLSTDPNFSSALTTTLAATTPVATGTTVAGIVTGSTDTTVSVQADGLMGNTTYYYRISATNVGGTTVSGVQSFTTLTDPMVMATGASLVGTNSAQLNATVDAMGAATTVTFVYGTEDGQGNFTPISSPLGAVQGVVPAGSTNAVVSVNTSASAPLTQGGNYAYEVTATSAGGSATTAPVTFQVEVLSGLTQQFPYYTVPSSTQVYRPPPALGSLQINLSPAASGNYTPGWRLVGEQLWHASGNVISGLTTGDYQVEYEPTSGYNQPPEETVSITSGTTTVNPTVLTRYYYPTPSAANLTLQIYLYPQNVGAQGGWRLYDPTNTALWNPSGYVLTGLSPGTYLVECEPVTGQITPPLASVVVESTSTVVGGVTTVNTATVGQISYSPTDTPSGVPPEPLSFATITDNLAQGQTMPYAYVGQIRSDVGLSSGFVVAPYVVATAAHVVFDDGTLTPDGKGSLGYVTNLQWLFEREAGTYDPAPQTPRGALVLSSYSADRVADGTPGVSSPTSQNQDVAALYFSTYAGGAGGGYSGYLASDAATNEFLTSTANKILVGYPVDFPASLDPATDEGQMFATPAVPNAFTQLQDGSGNLLEVYSTNALYSFGGNSGGPLCVQYNGANGTYYPAAIYLGESAQAVVRAIDSNVISLFTQAESNGEFNQNFTGGGTTLVSTTITGGSIAVASIQVNLPGAPAGAGWSLSPTQAGQAGGTTLSNLSAGTYTIYYTPVTGYQTPASAQVTLVGGQSSTFSATYEGITNDTSTGSGALNVTTTGSGDTAFGYDALASNTSGNNNTATGTGALFSNQTGSSNTATGASALYSNVSGTDNTANGYQALSFNTGSQNTAHGANALLGTTGSDGSANTANGYDALAADTTGYNNVANGYLSLAANTSGAANTANGAKALASNTTGYANTASGDAALQSSTTGYDNTADGYAALHANTGSENTAEGFAALYSNAGAANAANGYEALFANTGGYANTANGAMALVSNTIGYANTATGYAALFASVGSENTAYGFYALGNDFSGQANTALGYLAGSNVTTGSSNIEIGNAGAGTDAAAIRLGTQNTQTQTYIAGIYGTTGTGGLPVYVLPTGQLVYQPSSAKFKKNIRDMGDASDALLALRPVTFQYQADSTGTPQFGLVAEEVEKVAPDLVVRNANDQIEGVRYEAVNAMLLNEFQKQHQTIIALEKAMVEQARRAQEKDRLIAGQQAALLEQQKRAQQKDLLLHSLAARLKQIEQAHGQ